LPYSYLSSFSTLLPPPPSSTLFPYTTLFRSIAQANLGALLNKLGKHAAAERELRDALVMLENPMNFTAERRHREYQWNRAKCYKDRKSTRLNSSHLVISYAVFCLKKKKKKQN